MKQKIISKNYNKTFTVCIVIFCAIFCCLPVIKYFKNKKIIDNAIYDISKYQKIKNEQGLNAIKEINTDFEFWIDATDIEISLPVVSTNNKQDDFYLYHNFECESNIFGNPYMPKNFNATSDNIVVVGHSVFENFNGYQNVIFGNLNKYLEYNDSFSYKINLQTLTSNFEYSVVSAFAFDNSKLEVANKIFNTNNFESEEQFDDFVQTIKDMSNLSFDFDANYGDKFLTLYTCSDTESQQKIMIVAKLVD